MFDLCEFTKDFLTKPKFHGPPSIHFYPSEASVKVVDEFGDTVVHGTCLRRSYFRCMNEEGTGPNAISAVKFKMGDVAEDAFVDIWKQAGIFEARKVKWYDQKYNVSGELDVVVRDPNTGELVCVECKSISGYKAESEIFGTKWKQGKPKPAHLLQALVYMNQFKQSIGYTKLFYVSRDSAKMTEFTLRIVPYQEGDEVIWMPEINGKIDHSFCIQDIYDRYTLLLQHLRAKTPPDREFELVYSPERIEKDFTNKKISKSKYEAWKKKGTPIGDWNCYSLYCGYHNLCYKDQVVTEVIEDEQDE